MVEALKFPNRNRSKNSDPNLGRAGLMNVRNRNSGSSQSKNLAGAWNRRRNRGLSSSKSDLLSVGKSFDKKKKLKSYARYSLSIKTIAYIWPILYLLFHAVKKYLKGDENYCKFLDPKVPDAINVKNILSNNETNCWWVIIAVFLVLLAVIFLLALALIFLGTIIDVYIHPWKIFTVNFKLLSIFVKALID
ncbi:hypothetical protein K8R66_00200 [bacterium]|nr:hypothetical protein [bacterium]